MAPLSYRPLVGVIALSLVLGCQHQASSATTPPIGSDLFNYTWVLRSLNGQPTTLGVNGREATLRFGTDGIATGFGGCNRFRATYKVDGPNLHFQPATTTDAACDAGSSQERALTLALNQVRGWRLTGRHLELLDDGGGTVADLDRR